MDNPAETSIASVAEFLRSGSLATRVLALEHESGGQAGDETQPPQRRAMENAARLALLIARAYVGFVPASQGSGHDDDAHVAQHLATLQLDDFFVSYRGGGDGDDSVTLLGMDIIAPTPIPTRAVSPQEQQEQERRRSALQSSFRHLGKLLYSTFSLDETPPSNLVSLSSTSSPPPSSDDTGSEHSSKSRRTANASLFSRLVESKMFPVSICRLLSDLIDTGSGGKSESPFASFDAVMRDLEQMVSQPEVFLHDGHYSQGMPQAPVFGQAYHGRKAELAKLMNVTKQMQQLDGEHSNPGIECVFVSGIAGCGKSSLVQKVQDRVMSQGWFVMKAKFDRSTRHASRGTLSSMFDGLISHLVEMKDGGSPSDVEYAQRVSNTIVKEIGAEALPRLSTFLPSLPLLFDGSISIRSVSPGSQVEEAKSSNWILIYSLSKIVEAVLEPERYIMVYCDDLQWADKTSLSLIAELLTRLGSLPHVSQRCLFVGLYREEEVNGDEHPFPIQHSYLQLSSSVTTSEIQLSSLSIDDVAEMLMMDLQLPRRLVLDLAEVVYKRTAGHAIFAVQLLNSLLSDSTIAFSTEKCRYVWDPISIEFIEMPKSVAELIVSKKFASLAPESQRILHILSCFGIQTDGALLQLLDTFQPGIVASIDSFIESGILDRAAGLVIFSHDLIQEAIYESLPSDQRRELHLAIGIFLGTAARADASLSLASGMSQLQLTGRDFNAGRSLTSTLIALACDQVILAGPESIADEEQKVKLAEWLLSAGQKASGKSNYLGAQYYFTEGVKFLGDKGWHLDSPLCLDLHNGALVASFALSENEKVTHSAETIIAQASFEDSLLARQLNLRSLTALGRPGESVSQGIETIRQLGFDLPTSPTRESVGKAMATTAHLLSQFNADQIVNLCDQTLDGSGHRIMKVLNAFYGACYIIMSPFLPLVTCEIVKFSLQHGIAQEAQTAFASYGMFKLIFGDYDAGRYWADLVRAMSKKHSSTNFIALFCLHSTIDIWFSSARQVSSELMNYHSNALKAGATDLSILGLDFASRYNLLGGESLALLRQRHGHRLQLTRKYFQFKVPMVLLDGYLIATLTGNASDDEGMPGDTAEIEAGAKLRKIAQVLYYIQVYHVIAGFFNEDYEAAEKASKAAMSCPNSNKPEIFLIYHTFFRALVALRLYRQFGDDTRLRTGSEAMDKMRSWTYNSMPVFENKWLLLKAEYHSSFRSGGDDAGKFYEASIKAARDQGNIHELALAYQLFGDYYATAKRLEEANDCYNNAYIFYQQWGATAVAERLASKHHLEVGASAGNATQKRGRD